MREEQQRCGGYCPCRRARSLGIPIRQSDELPTGVWGYWDGESIVVDQALPHRQKRATIAHELVHAERGDQGLALRHAHRSLLHERTMERHVDDVAARALLPLHELADVLVLRPTELEAAELMDVDVDTVRARLDNLTDAEKEYIDRRLQRARGRLEGGGPS